MIQEIEQIIKKVVGSGVNFSVVESEKPEFGHYSTNVAFLVKEEPQKIADKIFRQSQGSKPPLFEKVEVKGRFINFWIKKEALIKHIDKILKAKKLKIKGKKLKINLEFVSANPTGPLTMANGRGGFWGDVLANVLSFVGHKITREYYINDAGNQMKILGESILAALGKAESKKEHYQGDYIKKQAEKIAKEAEALLENRSADYLQKIGFQASLSFQESIKRSLANAGIKFDKWFSEYNNLRKTGLINKILRKLEKKNLVIEKEGAKWLKVADKERVIVKSDGEPTYFLTDLAYHYDKLVRRKFDKAIDIWGADHHGNVKPLKEGIAFLGIDPDRLEIIVTQLVQLAEGGERTRMSKRKGEFVEFDELIKEVGKDAARFFFLMNAPETHMDFDLQLAKEQSLKNPVYYVQYAYVRSASILRNANTKHTNTKKIKISKLQGLKTESELELLKELVRLPDVVEKTANDYQVNRLARYALDVAKALHHFYEQERVVSADGSVDESRLALVAATKEILWKLFNLIGIEAPERM